ncbi:MAG: hypothetical protein KDA49_17195, partial [Rhodospirillaceae bacterium]|nr:hypothetical protein [Rhodospirillaceae bacterium]
MVESSNGSLASPEQSAVDDDAGTFPAAPAFDPVVRRALMILAVLAVLAAADVAAAVLVPFCFAVVLAAILSPLVLRIHRLGMPLWLGAVTALTMPFLALAAAIHFLVPETQVWRHRLPLFFRSLELQLDGLMRSLSDARDIAR